MGGLTPPHPAGSKQEGLVLLLLVGAGPGVAEAPRQLLRIFAIGSLTCFVRPHHQAMVLLPPHPPPLLAGPSELIHHVDGVRRLGGGQVHLEGRHAVRLRLGSVRLRVYRQEEDMLVSFMKKALNTFVFIP